MNRRVLLIDGDIAFRDTLTQQLGRYRVVVMTESDAERALSLVASDAPALIIIAVEEPEKAGFRVFQKCKKGALAKVPVILVTATVNADSFAKHRGLKVHADEYLDKRTMSKDELVGKIDNLIGLGDLDDEMDIPVEDDIPMEIADGDVVLDETVGDEADEFANEARTVGPGDPSMVDSLVSAETDAAFAAMFSGGDEPKLRPTPPRVAQQKPAPAPPPKGDEVSVVTAIPLAVPDPMGRPEVPDEVPMPIDDHAMPDAEDSFSRVGAPLIDAETAAAAGDADAHEHRHDPPANRYESSAAIAISDDELEPMDDELMPVEVEADEPPPNPSEQATVMRAPILHEAPTVARAPIITESAKSPQSRGTGPRFVETATTVERAGQSGSQPAIDLGLEAVAGDAERDQSGVYDRRALRKIGELERQIAQLKAELERTRSAADAAARGAGREKEFLNLRESLVAKDKEIKQAKDAGAANERELADAREKLRQAQHAKQNLETKASELEARILEHGGKHSELEGAAKTASSQLSSLRQELETKTRTLQQDIDAKAKAIAAAESARAALEQDLASERALRQSSASEAESALRVEREQLVQRHQAELDRVRSEAASELDVALEQQQKEIATAHQRDLDEAVETARHGANAERDQAIAALEKKHLGESVDLKAAHAGELSRVRSELGGELQRVQAALAEAEAAHEEATAAAAAERAAAMEEISRKHAEEIERKDQEFAEMLERDSIAQGAALADLKTELDRLAEGHTEKLGAARKELDDIIAGHEAAKGQLHEQHQTALAEAHEKHEAELAKLHEDRAQLVDAAKRTAESHRAALTDMQAKLESELLQAREMGEREAGEHRVAVQQARRAADEAVAAAQAERESVERAHAQAISELEARHERALAVANGEFLKTKSVADAEHNRAIAALKEELARTRSDLESQHARAIGELTSERDELRKGLSQARETLKRMETELASTVQSVADRNAELRSHVSAIAERDQRIADLRKEIESLEQENANYQEQVLRAYQKIKSDEAMVARAKKAMAIALTVLDDEGNPTSSSS